MRGDCSLKKEHYVVQVNKIKTVRRPQSRGVVSEAYSFLTYRPWQSPDSSQGCWLATVSRSTYGNLKRPDNSDKGHHRKEGCDIKKEKKNAQSKGRGFESWCRTGIFRREIFVKTFWIISIIHVIFNYV